MNRLRDELRNPHFFLLSDDIPWCREHLSADDVTMLDFNDQRHGFRDMVLASDCKHFILSELSTFSHQIVDLNRPHQDRIIIRSTEDDLARNGN